MRKTIAAVASFLTGSIAFAQSDTDLTSYFNKYPFEEVAGTKFTDHPSVTGVVRRSIPTRFLQDMILSDGHTSSPIDGVGGYMQSWSCEQHNCGDHNWVVVVKYDGSDGAVCYFNKDLSNGSRWFVNGEKVYEATFLDCRSGRLPNSVLTALGEEPPSSPFFR